jgi:AraC-like DNA-binding protein
MLESLNYILTAYVRPGLILCFGLSFFFIMVPDRTGLKGYRKARYMMGYNYLFYFVALVIQAFVRSTPSATLLHSMISIAIGLQQAFFFTYALTTLIDVQFFTWRRFLRETLIIVLPIVTSFILLSVPFAHADSAAFLLLTGCYFYKMADYTIRFHRHYRSYEQRMADYFSDDELKRLQWSKRSFYAALGVGIFALLYGLHPSMLTNTLFALLVIIYYSIFGYRFLNYAFTFQEIEVAMEAEPVNPIKIAPAAADDKTHRQLVSCLSDLMTSQQLYTKPDLTIEDVAVQVGESYRSVSAAINNCCDTNFKGWVNAYRVEEAIRLIRDGYLRDHTTDALAVAVGFTSRITFYRVFKSVTGQSPTDY